MRFVNLLFRYLAVLSGLLILVSALIITYAALARYLFHASSTWEGELPIYLLMASVWVGCGPTMLADRHVAIRLITKITGPRSTPLIRRFAYFACIVIAGLLCWQGIAITQQAIAGHWQASTVWSPSLALPYMIIPVGLGLFIIAATIRFVHHHRLPDLGNEGDDTPST